MAQLQRSELLPRNPNLCAEWTQDPTTMSPEMQIQIPDLLQSRSPLAPTHKGV